MIRESYQFGSFDGLDNRRELMILLQRLGSKLPLQLANECRAKFLQGLIPHSIGALAGIPIKVQPCDPVSAYHYLVAITGVLEVPIDKAARLLEQEVKRRND